MGDNWTKTDFVGENTSGTIRYKLTRRGMTMNSYRAELIEGTWPEKQELINLCDGLRDESIKLPPLESRNFGGSVTEFIQVCKKVGNTYEETLNETGNGKKVADVNVYTD